MHHFYRLLRQTQRENMDELHRSEDRRNSIREVLFAIEDPFIRSWLLPCAFTPDEVRLWKCTPR